MAKKKKTGLDLSKMKGETPKAKAPIIKKKNAKKKKPALAKKVLKNRDDLIDSYLVAIDGAQLLGGDENALKIRGVLSTQAPGLNAAIGRGGIPLGRLSILAGAEGCLTGDTLVSLNRRGKGFSCPIRHLVKMFNRGVAGGRKWNLNFETKIRALKDDGTIGLIKVKDAWFAGIKTVFEIKTDSRKVLKASGEHRFLTDDGWKPTSDLEVGDLLFVETSKRPLKKSGRHSVKHKTIRIKNHPFSTPKYNSGYHIQYHRLVYEAHENNIDVDSFIDKIRRNELDGIEFIDPKEFIIHHKDNDYFNNDVDNLKKITPEEHRKIHEKNSIENIAIRPVKSKIVFIRKLGETRVYDVETELPNNYLANGIVVHNSGKTTLALHLAAECQAQGGVVIYVDTEYKLDPDYAKAIGVDTKHLVILQSSHLEDFFKAGEHIIEQAKKYRIDVGVRIPILVIQDSMNSTISKAEYEGEHGDDFYSPQARVYSKSLPKFMPKVSKEDIALLFLGQQRKKIGVMFGDDFSLIGGSAPKHYSSLIMRIKRVGSIKRDNQQVASRVTVECVKNQIAPPFRKTECLIRYGEGIDAYHSLVYAAVELGIIEKAGAWYSYKGKNLGQGLESTAAVLEKRPKLYEKIKARLYKKSFVKSAR